MRSFRLDPEPPASQVTPLPVGAGGLASPVLLHNARWFVRIRWSVIALLLCFGAAGSLLDPDLVRHLGFLPPVLWPLRLAGILTILNLGSIYWLRHLASRASHPWRGVAANIWFQIITDLIALTALLCRAGPTQTVIAFAYLFHITLACIFFGRRDSLLVTLLSALLFLSTVVLDCVDLLPHPHVLAFDDSLAIELLPTARFAVPTVFVWFVVWYLVSSLSDAVRRRDHELDATNKQLMRADENINLQMLRVTHDLKAPFSGIESNIEVLKRLHWGELPEPVREIIGKIDARSMSLRARIGDILTLGSLRPGQASEQVIEPVNLRELLDAVLYDVRGLAEGKAVSVEISGDARVTSDARQLKILFSNLISNAIAYSHEKGTVEIGIETQGNHAEVRVVDHGIGISDKALPRIFEDFYRAREAADFNPNSTGLGLAIVRQVARNLRLAIVVESEQGKGTVFHIFISTTLPPAGEPAKVQITAMADDTGVRGRQDGAPASQGAQDPG